MAAVLLSVGEGSSKGSSNGDPDLILFYGIVPVLVASVLSGLASALCQWASQVGETCLLLILVFLWFCQLLSPFRILNFSTLL